MEDEDEDTGIAQPSMEAQPVRRFRLEEDCISYSQFDLAHVATPHEDALVGMVETDGFKMRTILIDR